MRVISRSPSFSQRSITYDLSSESDFRKVQILDIMKTMDNRISVDEETLKQFVPDEKLKELTAKLREKLKQIRERENTQTSSNTKLLP